MREAFENSNSTRLSLPAWKNELRCKIFRALVLQKDKKKFVVPKSRGGVSLGRRDYITVYLKSAEPVRILYLKNTFTVSLHVACFHWRDPITYREVNCQRHYYHYYITIITIITIIQLRELCQTLEIYIILFTMFRLWIPMRTVWYHWVSILD
jgi:hypothetical protein